MSDDERREVARRLRSFVTDDSVYADVDACRVLHSIGLYYKDVDRIYFSGFDVARLADLIDPACEAYRDAIFYPATGLAPEYEETVYRCGNCDEVVSDDEGYDPETDLPAYCMRCGSRITGIGEPWDE